MLVKKLAGGTEIRIPNPLPASFNPYITNASLILTESHSVQRALYQHPKNCAGVSPAPAGFCRALVR